jgi:hypothetical protein
MLQYCARVYTSIKVPSDVYVFEDKIVLFYVMILS